MQLYGYKLNADNKKWLSIIRKHTDLSKFGLYDKIAHYSYVPSVIVEDNGHAFVAELTNCRRNKNDYEFFSTIFVFDFSFEIGGKCIKEDNVFHIDLALKYSDIDYYHMTWSKSIMTERDFSDHFMIIYKNPRRGDKSRISDAAIYYNMEKLVEINNVYGYLTIKHQPTFKKCIELDPVFGFLRVHKIIKPCSQFNCSYVDFEFEKWLLINGKEFLAENVDLSLADWDKILSPSNNIFCTATTNYSPDNPVPVDIIKWNSEETVRWKCFRNHEWTESVKNITEKTAYSHFCPVCKTVLPFLTLDCYDGNAKKILALYSLVMKSRGINQIEEVRPAILPLYRRIRKKLLDKNTNAMKSWLKPIKEEIVKYYFTYPNGLSSEIDMFLCEKYGSVREISPFLYEASLLTEYKDKLVLLSEYSNIDLIYNPYTGMTFDTSNDEMDVSQYRRFMFEYNLLYRYMVLSIIKYCSSPKVSITTINEIDRYYYNEITEYAKALKEERKEVYNQVVLEGKALNKWKSEQALYTVVRYLFKDAVYQYHDVWLGGQSLDIYIPSLKVGIEYQGIQHFEAVDLFGGEEGLKSCRERDIKKKKCCSDNGVRLIEWKYTEKITLNNVKEVMKEYL